MAKRRTSGIQRRERASADALSRRLNEPSGLALPDWRLLAIGGVLVVGVLLIILVLVFGGGPSPSLGVRQPDDGTQHVGVGTICRAPGDPCGADPYSSVPATSGPHWDPSGIAGWGVYDTPQPESQLIHNLEHGGIVIWYDPGSVDQQEIDAMAQLVERQNAQGVGGRYKWILSPWGESEPLPAPIVATSWNWLLEQDEMDIGAIEAFADEHYGIAPEPNGGPGPPV
jgi:hypothetical protein